MSSGDKKKAAVPKFGSFKPQIGNAKDGSNSPSGQELVWEDRKAEEKRREHRPKEVQHRPHHRHHHRSRSQDKKSAQDDQTKKPEKDDQGVFAIDHRGDPLILRYGSNDRSTIPAYRRGGRGRILGSAGFLEIHRTGAKGDFTIRGHREGVSVFRDKAVLQSSAARLQGKRIKALSQADGGERDTLAPDEEFVALDPSGKRQKERLPIASLRHTGLSKLVPGEESSAEASDASGNASASSDDEPEVTSAKRKSVELSQHVKAHPEDVEAWLGLVNLQDQILAEAGHDSTAGPEEIRGIARIKLSMLESALSHASTPSGREKLELALMREAAKAWDSKTLARRWMEISDSSAENFPLWKGRLDFEMTNMATFAFESLRDFQTAKLQRIGEQISGAAEEEIIELCRSWIYVFLRTTRFLHDAGYRELATAAWQALLEATFARPTPAADTTDTLKASLSDFWESEAARIGEDGAMGWLHFAVNENIEAPEAKTAKRAHLTPARDAYTAWLSAEQAYMARSEFPARTLDDEDDDDPFRVVLFSDIEPLVFLFPDNVIPRVRSPLLDAFLLFCGLPPAECKHDMIRLAWADPFIWPGGRTLQRELITDGLDETILAGELRGKPTPSFDQDAPNVAVSPDVLFSSGSTWFGYLSRSGARAARLRSLQPLALHVLRQVVRQYGVEEFAEYSLALEWLHDPAGIRKAAKAILKQYSANTRLYNAYALIEWTSGNVENAHKVLNSATAQYTGSPTQREIQLLWNTWTWIELESGHLQRALERLCTAAVESQGETMNPATASVALVLKARSTFASARDYLLSSARLREALCFAESLALLEYLAPEGGSGSRFGKQGNINAALSSVISFSEELIQRGHSKALDHERFLQFAAKLLYFHAKNGSFRPLYLQEQLRRLITLFPRNTIFLELFAWADSSFRLNDPVRQLLASVILASDHDCTSSRAFAIRHELQKGTVHSVRAALESALSSEASRSSWRLWERYIQFCSSTKELQGTAKQVFYRALASCPWSKELALEAFGHLRGDMDARDLRSVYEAIVAKGLRIHVELEPFVKKWERKG